MKTVFCFFLLFHLYQFAENSDELGRKQFNVKEVNDGKSDQLVDVKEEKHYGSSDELGREDSKEEGNDGVNNYDDNLEGKDYNRDPIIRPCSLQDLKCIRGFFAHYSQCLEAEGPVPEPYFLHLLPNIHIPHVNLTFELHNAQIKGLNKWKIMEFYINKDTDRLVLEVQFDRIVVTCPEANLKYHRKGKEPLEVSDFSVIEYRDLSFTLTIPHIKDLQLSRGNVYTYNNDAAPKYTLGAATFSSKDPGFISAVIELQLKVGLTLQEIFVTQGPVFFSAFFNSSICHFRYY